MAISHGNPVILRTRGNYYLNTDHGTGPEVKVIEDYHPDPAHSDEAWFVERIGGPGEVQHGDPVILRTRGNYYLNTDHGTGPKVKVVDDYHPDPAHSDEVWFIERIGGPGTVQFGDPIVLRTRGNYYLNTDHGTGPEVKVVEEYHPDPAISDEVWFIERMDKIQLEVSNIIINSVQKAINEMGLKLGNKGSIKIKHLDIQGTKVSFKIGIRYRQDPGRGLPEISASASIEGDVDVSDINSIANDIKICTRLNEQLFGGPKLCITVKELAELISVAL
ncbi:hypothetical protein U9R71_17215 [Bacillus toyonensis]|uniref:hypothetical protein n=1 Tax=Bacillus toyonensis TaxID=155322 RepID=UPI0034674520